MSLVKIFEEVKLENALKVIFDFDNVNLLDFTRSGNKYRFNIQPDAVCEVNFEDVSSDKHTIRFAPLLQNVKQIVNVNFTINGDDTQYKKTDIAYITTVLFNVVNCINDYISRNDPECLLVIPLAKTGIMAPDRQKDMVYRYICRKYAPSGYGISDIKVISFNGFCLYNIDQLKHSRIESFKVNKTKQ